MLDILALQTSSTHPTLITVVYNVLLSFLLSTAIAVTYEKTFRGLSYSRNFVQSLVMSSIVAATIMQAIGDSLAGGLGMIGALAIIRFRTNFKDPRDIIFMFSCLAAGVACGVGGYNIAVVGTAGFCFAAMVLYRSPFGQTSRFDGMLRFSMENDSTEKAVLEKILTKYCRPFALITLRDMAQGKRLDYAYHVKLKKGRLKDDLIGEMSAIGTISNISLLLQETTVEL